MSNRIPAYWNPRFRPDDLAAGDTGAEGGEAPPPAPPAGAAAPQTPPDDGGWQGEYLDTDLRGSPVLGRFKSVNDLGKAYLEANTKLSSRGITKPGEGADSTEWDAFYKDLGRPETPDGYDLSGLQVPESVEYGAHPDFEKRVLERFHQRNLTNDQAVGVIQDVLEEFGSTQGATAEAHEAAIAEWDREIRREWGSAYDEKFDLADRALKAALGPELAGQVGNLSLPGGGVFGAHPQILKMFAEVGALRAEQGLLGDKRPTRFSKTPEEARQEINALKGDAEFRAQFRAGNGEAKQRWDDLHRQAYPDDQEGELNL